MDLSLVLSERYIYTYIWIYMSLCGRTRILDGSIDWMHVQ